MNVILAIALLNNQVQVSITNTKFGELYYTQQSTDMVHWTNEYGFEGDGGIGTYTFTEPLTNSCMFYRVVDTGQFGF